MNLAEQIFNAGIVGCGGAGFPTHIKFQKQAEYLLINGAECEPLLYTDRYVMRECATQVVSAAAALCAEIQAQSCLIVLKEHYQKEIAALQAAITETQAKVGLCLLESFYPSGDEHTLVYEATGRLVPPGGLPLDVGCVVTNAATALAVYDAMGGQPFTHKYLTVSGAVTRPVIVRAPIGTSLLECLELAGGASINDYCALLGGPMMGQVIGTAELKRGVVTKTLSGMIILEADNRLRQFQELSQRQMSIRARAACIRCSQCSDLCPRYLLGHPLQPHRVMRQLALSKDVAALPLDDPAIQSAALCCECGVCELVACPMGLQPRRINAALKKRLAQTGFRYPKGAGQSEAHSWRDMRKLPTARAAARAGIYRYQDIVINELAEATPRQVCLPLSQHSGAPSEALVGNGERVSAGQLIARCPEGKLGANLHASISGEIKLADEAMIISAI